MYLTILPQRNIAVKNLFEQRVRPAAAEVHVHLDMQRFAPQPPSQITVSFFNNATISLANFAAVDSFQGGMSSPANAEI
jgi:hypothetical protein